MLLARLLQNELTDLPDLLEAGLNQSMNDFGAGVGQYGHALRARSESIRWRGYDGAGNVEEVTRGFVRFFDLSLPMSLPRADWVLSLEVGEHLPHALEPTYLRNIHAHNCKGVIISWAGRSRGPGTSTITINPTCRSCPPTSATRTTRVWLVRCVALGGGLTCIFRFNAT